MSALDRIAHFQGRRDEVPNQELARDLVARRDRKGIREIAENLWNAHAGVQGDCLKVLYEIGYLDPSLIAAYAGDFVELTQSKHNRLVWGSMIALSTVASLEPRAIMARLAELQGAIERGSVITVDNGVKTLARVAATSDARRKNVFPYLRRHLSRCRSKDVPQHCEHIKVAVDAKTRASFVRVLERRIPELTIPQSARVRRVIRAVTLR